MIVRGVRFFALCLMALVACPSMASAKTVKKKVGASIVFKQATNPKNATNCGVIPVLQWKDPTDKEFFGSSWEGHYFYFGKETVTRPTPPFNNTFTWLGVDFSSGSSNWWLLGDGTWRAGGDPGEAQAACGEYLTKAKQAFGANAWVIVTGENQRVITGKVRLSCSGGTSCSIHDGIGGIKVSAGSESTTTDDDGRYKLGVGKGKYTVRAKGTHFRVTTKAQTVDLTKKKSATANFDACGAQSAKASTRAATLPAVTLSSQGAKGVKGCANRVTVRWSPPRTLSFRWEAAPNCGGRYYDKDWGLLERTIDQATDVLKANADSVQFSVPGQPGYFLGGTIKAKSGTFAARIPADVKPYINQTANTPCAYVADDVPLTP